MGKKDLDEGIINKMGNEHGCPICSLLLEYEFDMLAKIQFGITHDKSLRMEVASEGGFCDFHFRQFKRIANFKTNTMLLQAIVESGYYKNVVAEINCRFCRVIDKAENELINDMAELLANIDFQNRYEQSNGVCVVHLKRILETIKQDDLKEQLIKIHCEQVERLKLILEELNSAESYWNIEMGKREFVNILIQKFAGRKTAGV
jgi:hypothetical protein